MWFGMALLLTSCIRNEIRGKKEIELHDLNAGTNYYFAVDAFNDSGRTLGAPAAAR